MKAWQSKDLHHAKQLHAYMCEHHIDSHAVLGNHLVPTLVACGCLHDAQHVFNSLPYRSEHSWCSLISGYAESDQPQHAFNLYDVMLQNDCIAPTPFTFLPLLKSCARFKNGETGRRLHFEIVVTGHDLDHFLCNTLMDMYTKCAMLHEAYYLFDTLAVRDVVSWNALIAGYVHHGFVEETGSCMRQMELEGVSPSHVSYLCSLKASEIVGCLQTGQRMHTEICKRGFEVELHVGNTLVDMYVKCGSIVEAHSVFNCLPVQDAPSWAALISGYAELGYHDQVNVWCQKMKCKVVSVDLVTFVRLLKACSTVKNLEMGREIHSEIKKAQLEVDLVGNTLIDMYVKCGSIAEAQDVFEMLPVRDSVSWNALICGYAEHGADVHALNMYDSMLHEGANPVDATFLGCLKACGNLKNIDFGYAVCLEIVKAGFDGSLFLGSAMVDMLGSCGLLAEAQYLFDRMPVQNAVSWTSLIGTYADHGRGEEALECFQQMLQENVSPVAFTYPSCLRAVGIIGSLQGGWELHGNIVRKGYELDLSVSNVLIEMYSECGSFVEACTVFEKMCTRDVVSWTSIIKACGENENAGRAIQFFEHMQVHGVEPNAITFTCILAACSHESLVFNGCDYFKMMQKEYSIKPAPDHHACMIDLLARSGNLFEAARFVEAMQCPLRKEILRALLTACKIHGEVELGLRCFQHLVQLSQDDAASYLLMADIYRSVGMWDGAVSIEVMRNQAHALKKLASASIEVHKQRIEFIVGDSVSLNMCKLFEALSQTMKCEGHVPNLDSVW